MEEGGAEAAAQATKEVGEEAEEGEEGVVPTHVLEAQGYRAPGAWVYGEGEEEGDEEGDLPLRSGAGGSDAEGCAEDAPDGAGLPEYASSQAAVEGMLSALELEYAACQAAGSATVAALPPPLDPGPPPDASIIRSPLVAAAFAGRPDLRAKLEALKRLKSTWVSFEGGEGEGAGAGAAEEEFPEDYAALQRADAEALAAARAASAASGGSGDAPVGEGVDWADFALADPPTTSAPPAAATGSAAHASGQLGAVRGGAARAVSPLALAKKQAIAEVMSRFTLTPRGGVSPWMEAQAQQALAAGRALAQPKDANK